MPYWAVLLLVFPIVCAAIGYVTNVLAVKMIFRPHERRRVLGVAFQGVLPKHQDHFSSMLAGIIVRDFMTTGELVGELASPGAVDALEAEAKVAARDLVDDIQDVLPPAKRAMLAPPMVAALIDQIAVAVRAELPAAVAAVQSRADELVDLEPLVTEKFIAIGPRGLEEVIYEVSRRELTFIELYGAVFGAALGFLQFGVLQVLGNIALPIVGALVGTVTNWLAIQMLFYPREPRTYLGVFRYQGMFPRRQTQIASSLGHLAASRFLRPAEIFERLLVGLLPGQVDDAALDHAEGWLRQRIPPLGQVLDGLLGQPERAALRARLQERYPELLDAVGGRMVAAAADQVPIDDLITAKVAQLDKSGFETLLRGLFEREEFYLIVYGGVLGALMGLVQLAIVHAAG